MIFRRWVRLPDSTANGYSNPSTKIQRFRRIHLAAAGDGRSPQLDRFGAAASEAGFNAGVSPARRIRLFTPENGADVTAAR